MTKGFQAILGLVTNERDRVVALRPGLNGSAEGYIKPRLDYLARIEDRLRATVGDLADADRRLGFECRTGDVLKNL